MKNNIVLVIALVCFFNLFSQVNIIVIESDDQSNVAVGAYGFGTIKTPNIDKIVKSGTYFTNAYNMGCWSPAVCIPSRTMLFNGTFLWNSSKIKPDNVPGPSLTEHLKKAGYETYLTGKWHALGKAPKETFDNLGTILPGQLKTYNSPKGHCTDIVGKETVSFINNAAKKDKPFFIYTAFNAPHVPRQTSQVYYDMYPINKVVLPPSVKPGPLHPHIKYNYTSAPLNSNAMKARYQQNNAMVTHMDDRIGEIIDALKTNGLYENTIIVFMSDHGISFGENGVAGKVCLYDISAKAPLIISGPGLPKNVKNAERIYLQDIYPTLLELVGIEAPNYIEFNSLKPLIQKQKEVSSYSSIYLAMFNDQRAIVANNYKLLLYPKGKAAELYDLDKDPWETKNIILNDKNNSRLKEMGKALLEWQEKTGDTLNLKTIYPKIF